MAKMVEITCKCGCGMKRMVRLSDVKRGWGKFYSKSCKARWQEAHTGQYYRYLNRSNKTEKELNDEWFYSWPEGWDEHKM